MKKSFFLLLSICATVLLVSQAWAVTLDFVPSSQTVNVGDKVVVYLHVSDLGGYAVGPSVGSFDIDVIYGSSSGLLEFKSATFSSYLGDPSDPAETNISLVDFPNSFFWVAERSLLTSSDLNNRQGYSATLVKLTFIAKQIGSCIIGGDLYALKDENDFDLINPFGRVSSAVVNVINLSNICEGDFNSDGDVDSSDLAVFATDFGRTDCPNRD
jgi:hypothetical protein